VPFHAVPVLWRLHRMHHADLDFDVTTGVRFHPVEILLSMLYKFALIVALGSPAIAVMIFEVLLLPTDGMCRAVLAWRIDRGHSGDTRLDGPCAVNTYAWPGAVHHGNGRMQSIIDERATDTQRADLVAILQGWPARV
jgi:uncharacterized protein DUF1326/fatty acid hydroxylase family protein